MTLSILTTITNPKERQDRFEEAFANYKALADEVIIVDGSRDKSQDGRIDDLGKMKVVYVHWPEEWNWIELPKHLNAGLKQCTGDWILKLDIDQFIHENDFGKLRNILEHIPQHYDTATMQKMSFTFGNKYYQKGEQEIILRNKPYIRFGENVEKKTDLCFPIDTRNIKGMKSIVGYILALGTSLQSYKTGVKYWNYDYFFKTEDVTRKEFWRFSQAWYRYYGTWDFGNTEEAAFQMFLRMMQGRYERSPYEWDIQTHPDCIRKEIEALKPEQFGYNGWKHERNT